MLLADELGELRGPHASRQRLHLLQIGGFTLCKEIGQVTHTKERSD